MEKGDHGEAGKRLAQAGNRDHQKHIKIILGDQKLKQRPKGQNFRNVFAEAIVTEAHQSLSSFFFFLVPSYLVLWLVGPKEDQGAGAK